MKFQDASNRTWDIPYIWVCPKMGDRPLGPKQPFQWENSMVNHQISGSPIFRQTNLRILSGFFVPVWICLYTKIQCRTLEKKCLDDRECMQTCCRNIRKPFEWRTKSSHHDETVTRSATQGSLRYGSTARFLFWNSNVEP